MGTPQPSIYTRLEELLCAQVPAARPRLGLGRSPGLAIIAFAGPLKAPIQTIPQDAIPGYLRCRLLAAAAAASVGWLVGHVWTRDGIRE